MALLLTRYRDDWAYPSVLRTTRGMQVWADRCGVTSADLGDQEAAIAQVVSEDLRALYDRHLGAHVVRRLAAPATLGPVRFPWQRLFAIEVPVALQPPTTLGRTVYCLHNAACRGREALG